MTAEQARQLKQLRRRRLHMLDAVLVALYTLGFAIVLYALLAKNPPGDRLSTTIILSAIEAMLFATGWRNIALHVGEGLCILYRNGFIPLYTAVFTLAAWVYYWTPPPPNAVEVLILALVTFYIAARMLGDYAVRLMVLYAPIVGALTYLLYPQLPDFAIAFSVPQIAIAAAKPRLLCDDRPVLIVAGLYSLIGSMIVESLFTLHAL